MRGRGAGQGRVAHPPGPEGWPEPKARPPVLVREGFSLAAASSDPEIQSAATPRATAEHRLSGATTEHRTGTP